ncbi:MAG: AAA family ATPase, partial [Planctomycetes bacterium]|nr:AAA family ATPase [Planctomycetota bacterium]
MIIEGFEIENWGCIKRVAVTDLPSGVVVLHGPNGTGKSSIIAALRACLMDNKSTSKSLDRGFPKNSSEKPRVTVTFRAGGTTWKITKQFSSKNSKLESLTAGGAWKLESDDPSESHDRTRRLLGDSDSNQGLHQLLWLTQAEFKLPKKFDSDVQSSLRGVLGVLQTPLDDRFLGRIKDQWSRWFTEKNKPGSPPKLKANCSLDKSRLLLEKYQKELAAIEEEFQAFEKMSERSASLEMAAREFRQQIAEQTLTRDRLQEEFERSLSRVNSHRLAEANVAAAGKLLDDSRESRTNRAEAERRLRDAEKETTAAERKVAELSDHLKSAEASLRDLRSRSQELITSSRVLRERRDAIDGWLRQIALKGQLKSAQDVLRRAEQAVADLEKLKHEALSQPAPDAATLKKLRENRTKAGQLRANLEAAAISLKLIPDAGASPPKVTVDGKLAARESPLDHFVRRRAEV